MGEQFCLRWNNHQNTLISVFDNLLGTETLVDCTLVAEGKFVKGHKVVLSACSPLLEMLLSQHHDKHPIVILKDIKFHELRAMMDYMYRGEVNISQDQIDMFLKAAESLQIKGLTDQDTSSSCDNQQQQQPNFSMAVTPSPGGGAGPPPEAPTRTSPSAPVKPEPPPPPQSHHQQSSSSSNSIDHIVKTKVEPTELLVQPKAEYIESLNNDDSVEDLTLDDEDEYSNMPPQPGTSHGNNISNQGKLNVFHR
ncbi:hypothetical protein AAG570_013560 [Ranatra chinensis]|uniref:BTB domain-containing protein n=1 Tax=Ranatra chinensis TaxID=642074 RepID=A0ABD0YV22_9HEMI